MLVSSRNGQRLVMGSFRPRTSNPNGTSNDKNQPTFVLWYLRFNQMSISNGVLKWLLINNKEFT